MSKVIKWWCDNGANYASCVRGTITVEELGFTDAEWDALSDDQREDTIRVVALNCLDWGFGEVDNE